MLADIWTVFWREARQNRAQFDDRRRLAIGLSVTALFLIGLEIVFNIHRELDDAPPVLLIWIWCWLPLGSAVTMATDAVAGERERHTLETLLSTRLPARAILAGKVLAITAHSWLSAAALALGILLALNTVTIWNRTLYFYPPSVALFGSVVSFLLTMLGTLVAIFLSMNAPTVRQANLRVILITSMLPILLIVPVALLIVFGLVALALLTQATGVTIDSISRPSDAFVSLLIASAAIVGLVLAIAVVFAVTSLRFTRQKLMCAFARQRPATRRAPVAESSGTSAPAQPPLTGEILGAQPALSYHPAGFDGRRESRLEMVLRDAAAVAWKEFAETRALAREWRGWLLLAAVVVLIMALQLSAFLSWFWVQGQNFSLMFWLAMAAILPILIAQRSADSVAGERERHTGEILFTTRLSAAGILAGKLAVIALLPWTLALGIPLLGLVTTNLLYAARGPFVYPLEIATAGATLSLGVAILYASAGMLLSIGAPTVQHAARRISWFLMPILIAPGLAYRGSLWGTAAGQDRDAVEEGMAGVIASGDALVAILLAVPVLLLVNTGLLYLLWIRFERGKVTFD